MKGIKKTNIVKSMYFRNTTTKDLIEVLNIYQHSIRFMRENGNDQQWTNFDDLKTKIICDIRNGISHVLIEDEEIKAVFTLLTSEEHTYNKIQGKWIDSTPYYTIHRIAIKENHKGYASKCFCYAFLQNRHIRIDTHEKNLPMRNLLKKEGFSYCGIITLEDKTKRLAFEKTADFSTLLLSYYLLEGRKLPWREDPTFYHVYLSEVMLQQTRVEAVKKYYDRFLKTLPTIKDLAEAKENVYLKLWEGLGYYSRIRNLHKGAIYLIEKGELPKTYDELLKVPGIGEYTAKAILAIAYQNRVIAVDGNLLRIFSRLTSYEKDITTKEAKADCDSYFLPKLKEHPEQFNQALMDLGELICLPNGTPKCLQCPLKDFCHSYKVGNPLSYPKKKKKIEKKNISLSVFLINYKDRYLIEKREEKGLLASLYGFPTKEGKMTLKEAKEYLEKKGFSIESISYSQKAKHTFTHLIWNMQGFSVILKELPKEKLLFITKEELMTKYAIPSAFKTYKEKILKGDF